MIAALPAEREREGQRARERERGTSTGWISEAHNEVTFILWALILMYHYWYGVIKSLC